MHSSAKFTYFCIALFLLSQGYLIPIFPVGPTWTLWPRLCDLAWIGMMIGFILERSSMRRRVPYVGDLYLLFGVCFFTVLYGAVVTILSPFSNSALPWASHHLVRTFQFLTLFVIASQLPINIERIELFHRLSLAALLISIFGVIVVYFQLFPSNFIAPMVPWDSLAAGPWFQYHQYEGRLDLHLGYGFASYNHAYTGLQIILLLGLTLHLGKYDGIADHILIFLSVVAVALSGSRAGLASLILYVGIYLLRKPQAIALYVVLFLFCYVLFQSDLGVYLGRHEVLVSGEIDDDTTNGRVSIWMDYLKYLNQYPSRWILGCGLGSSIDIKEASPANAAHMLPLQIVAELGILGIVVFGVVTFYVFQHLALIATYNSSMLWCSLALLFSCLTQETFYPMPAMGFFPGFYLFSLAITLSASWYRLGLNQDYNNKLS